MSRGHLLDWSIIGLVVLVAGWRAGSQLGALAGFEGDTPAPVVPLVSLDGYEGHLPHAPGKVTVVFFWATWCGECKPEIRSLQELKTELRSEDLRIYTLSVGSEPAGRIRAFTREHGPDLWVGRSTPQLRAAFGGVPGVPTTFVIDRAGKIRHRLFGPLSTVALRTAVVRLLERPA